MINTDAVTRIEVLESGKRRFVKWDCKPAFMLQDGGRTLKIFIDGDIDCNKIKTAKDMKDIANYKNGKLTVETKQELLPCPFHGDAHE